MEATKVSLRGSGRSVESVELAWAAGLFIGEGCFSVKRSKYFSMGIAMQDELAIKRFAQIVEPLLGESQAYAWRYRIQEVKICHRVRDYKGVQKEHWEICVQGARGIPIARALYPYMIGTKKGEQLERVFARLGLEL
jgi:hypothetical protein